MCLDVHDCRRRVERQRDDALHHVRLLGQALGLMLHKAGVVNPGMALTGPQLLLAVEDYLGVKVEVVTDAAPAPKPLRPSK